MMIWPQDLEEGERWYCWDYEKVEPKYEYDCRGCPFEECLQRKIPECPNGEEYCETLWDCPVGDCPWDLIYQKPQK